MGKSGLYGKSFVERWDWPLAESDGDSGTDRARLGYPTQFCGGIGSPQWTNYFYSAGSRKKMFAIDPNRLEITKAIHCRVRAGASPAMVENLWISDGTPRIRKWRDGRSNSPFQ